MKRTGVLLAAATSAALVAGEATFRPDRAIRAGSGLVSHTLCSAAFVSRLDPALVYASVLRPMGGIGMLDPLLRYRVDTVGHSVTTTVAGSFRTRAAFRSGAGCVMVHGAAAPGPGVSRANAAAEDTLPVATTDERIHRVLDRLFARPDLATTAVVIMHGDSIIAERYAEGYSVTTRLHGWSMEKSVLSALVGVLVAQGRLDVHAPAAVPEWNTPQDGRSAITVDNLLRMTSGLALPETHSGFDPVSRMLFLEPDMAAFAAGARLEATPGSRWRYTTGNTAIVGRLIRELAGGSADDVVRFADRELFGPLHMSTATLELDAAGTPTAVYASARDWARFGGLFALDGTRRGVRILPEGWVRYSVSPTLDVGYGAGWWLGGPRWRPDWGLPPDAFYASGHLHQRVLVVPSARLVIARFGATHVADDRFGTLAQEVLGAVEKR